MTMEELINLKRKLEQKFIDTTRYLIINDYEELVNCHESSYFIGSGKINDNVVEYYERMIGTGKTENEILAKVNTDEFVKQIEDLMEKRVIECASEGQDILGLHVSSRIGLVLTERYVKRILDKKGSSYRPEKDEVLSNIIPLSFEVWSEYEGLNRPAFRIDMHNLHNPVAFGLVNYTDFCKKIINLGYGIRLLNSDDIIYDISSIPEFSKYFSEAIRGQRGQYFQFQIIADFRKVNKQENTELTNKMR